jgi:hypothetical protein
MDGWEPLFWGAHKVVDSHGVLMLHLPPHFALYV